MSKSSVIRTLDLVKRFGSREVVREVNVEVATGEIVGLLGPNGAGKTTTFLAIVGLLRPTAGQVLLDDEDITSMPMFLRARRGVGYLPQEPSTFRKLSVEDNLRAIAETLPISLQEQGERVEAHLCELGLKKLSRAKAYSLSGGERRRLEISRALVTQPKFLLMDEPFSGVDPISVSDVQRIIRRLRDKGIGVLITDHNVRETLRIVDRAYLMHDGKVLVSGDADTLLNDEQSRKLYLGEDFSV
ncbi:MAG: LPS export ABC transporter ATP-binding protein [Opitutales bacterium]|nr:LPS export ABC transporter ATP-binding protein [Opitutales bacterium]